MGLTELLKVFSAERTKYRDPDIRYTIDRLERAAEAALYETRQVVSDVAKALGTDIDSGPGSHWDEAHMRRVVVSAEAIKAEYSALRRAYETKPARMHLDGPGADKVLEAMHRETSLAYRANRAQLERTARENDDLRATIVSQAREIARLKGEGS